MRGRGSISPKAAFQSTPSGGKATGGAVVPAPLNEVSIHAFRGEGDGLRAFI